MEKVRVALIQMSVTDDKQVNVTAAAENVHRAAVQGAQIVMLPEMFCCPYENQSFVRNAEPAGGSVWNSLSEMASDNGILLIGGSIPEQDKSHLYNTCFIFDKTGHEIGKHRKIHLFDIDIQNGQYFKESDTFTPGDHLTVLDTEFGWIGVEICFDIRFTEVTHQMALNGAKMIFVPGAFNQTTGPAHWELHFRARALDSEIYMFGCAPALNKNASYHSYGHSIITSPWGNVVAKLDDQPGMLIQDIDLSEITSVREQLPIMKS